MYPGVWRHGDWIEITSRGTAVIYGRSDSTINRGGVRMGTSEIYRAVLALDEIVDALVVDVREGGDWMALFVVLREGAALDDELRGAIARRVREDCSPRHVPDDVFAVAEVPRTLSGKLLEVPVKRILAGDAARARGEPRLARQPGGAGLVRGVRAGASGGAREQEPREEEAAPARAGGRGRGAAAPRAAAADAARGRAARRAAPPAAGPRRARPSRLEIRDGVPRPDAIWAPFPLTEIGMAVGLVLFLIGFAGAPGAAAGRRRRARRRRRRAVPARALRRLSLAQHPARRCCR